MCCCEPSTPLLPIPPHTPPLCALLSLHCRHALPPPSPPRPCCPRLRPRRRRRPPQEHGITSDEALVLDHLPEGGSLAIVGAGYIAVEFAGGVGVGWRDVGGWGWEWGGGMGVGGGLMLFRVCGGRCCIDRRIRGPSPAALRRALLRTRARCPPQASSAAWATTCTSWCEARKCCEGEWVKQGMGGTHTRAGEPVAGLGSLGRV